MVYTGGKCSAIAWNGVGHCLVPTVVEMNIPCRTQGHDMCTGGIAAGNKSIGA